MKGNSWRELIHNAMSDNSDEGRGWSHVASCTLTDEELDVRFDSGIQNPNGKPFTLWTGDRVYFPVHNEDIRMEWVGSVSRNPDGQETNHQ